jgi:2-polyprenyl-3-methyl-5-hydroxy-6-metoxy-1,4-benzoquinol methylase
MSQPPSDQVELPNDFERMVPEFHRGSITYGEHISRYQAALPLVRDKVVLDIACGSGYGSKLLANTAKQVYGVDISETAVAYAQTHFGASHVSYQVGSGTDLPLGDGSVDVVVTFETIEHIADYRRFMSEAKRVLKPGGLMILSTPNDLEFAEGNHFHIHEFTRDELKSLVDDYFRHSAAYYQGTWVYAGLFSEQEIKSEWDKPIRTLNAQPLVPEQVLYFYLLCSDEPIQALVPPIGVLSEHYSARLLQHKQDLTDPIADLKNIATAARAEAEQSQAETEAARTELRHIHKSRTYRLLIKLQNTYHRLRP